MDVDQSFLPAPCLVKAAIFESFAGQNMSESDIDVTPSVRHIYQEQFWFLSRYRYRIHICRLLEGGPLCFPAGSNGNYVSAAKFLKANIVNIPTEYEVGFKVTEKTLVTILETVKKPWVNISGPTVNPTGLVYSNKEMCLCKIWGKSCDWYFILGIAIQLRGLGWLESGRLFIEAVSSVSLSLCSEGCLRRCLLTGALTFGFLVPNQRHLVDAFSSFPRLRIYFMLLRIHFMLLRIHFW